MGVISLSADPSDETASSDRAKSERQCNEITRKLNALYFNGGLREAGLEGARRNCPLPGHSFDAVESYFVKLFKARFENCKAPLLSFLSAFGPLPSDALTAVQSSQSVAALKALFKGGSGATSTATAALEDCVGSRIEPSDMLAALRKGYTDRFVLIKQSFDVYNLYDSLLGKANSVGGVPCSVEDIHWALFRRTDTLLGPYRTCSRSASSFCGIEEGKAAQAAAGKDVKRCVAAIVGGDEATALSEILAIFDALAASNAALAPRALRSRSDASRWQVEFTRTVACSVSWWVKRTALVYVSAPPKLTFAAHCGDVSRDIMRGPIGLPSALLPSLLSPNIFNPGEREGLSFRYGDTAVTAVGQLCRVATAQLFAPEESNAATLAVRPLDDGLAKCVFAKAASPFTSFCNRIIFGSLTALQEMTPHHLRQAALEALSDGLVPIKAGDVICDAASACAQVAISQGHSFPTSAVASPPPLDFRSQCEAKHFNATWQRPKDVPLVALQAAKGAVAAHAAVQCRTLLSFLRFVSPDLPAEAMVPLQDRCASGTEGPSAIFSAAVENSTRLFLRFLNSIRTGEAAAAFAAATPAHARHQEEHRVPGQEPRTWRAMCEWAVRKFFPSWVPPPLVGAVCAWYPTYDHGLESFRDWPLTVKQALTARNSLFRVFSLVALRLSDLVPAVGAAGAAALEAAKSFGNDLKSSLRCEEPGWELDLPDVVTGPLNFSIGGWEFVVEPSLTEWRGEIGVDKSDHLDFLDSSGAIILRLNPRRNEGILAMNSFRGGWGPEHRALLPSREGSLKFAVSVKSSGFEIYLNDRQVAFYPHRLPWASFSKITKTEGWKVREGVQVSVKGAIAPQRWKFNPLIVRALPSHINLFSGTSNIVQFPTSFTQRAELQVAGGLSAKLTTSSCVWLDGLQAAIPEGPLRPLGGGGLNQCASTPEGQVAKLSCEEDGGFIEEVVFASYGTATGSCGAFQNSQCHSASSVGFVRDTCVGKPSCSISVLNSIFGDPCWGIHKKLMVEVRCSNTAFKAVNRGLVFDTFLVPALDRASDVATDFLSEMSCVTGTSKFSPTLRAMLSRVALLCVGRAKHALDDLERGGFNFSKAMSERRNNVRECVAAHASEMGDYIKCAQFTEYPPPSPASVSQPQRLLGHNRPEHPLDERRPEPRDLPLRHLHRQRAVPAGQHLLLLRPLPRHGHHQGAARPVLPELCRPLCDLAADKPRQGWGW